MKGPHLDGTNQITFSRLRLSAAVSHTHVVREVPVGSSRSGRGGTIGRNRRPLAPALNQRSALGAYLDPIADKLLLSSSFLILAFKKQLAWWLTIIVLSRDVLILIVAVVILLVSGYRPFPPSIYGKSTTATQIVLVFTVFSRLHIPILSWAHLSAC